MTTDVDILQGDDWVGLFVNKELVYQGHSLPLFVIAEELSHVGSLSIDITATGPEVAAYLEEHGQFEQYLGPILGWMEENYRP